MDCYPRKKYLIKHEILLRDIELWNFIFDQGLFQLSGEKICLFTTSIWKDAKNCMLLIAYGIHGGMSHHSVSTLEIESFF